MRAKTQKSAHCAPPLTPTWCSIWCII